MGERVDIIIRMLSFSSNERTIILTSVRRFCILGGKKEYSCLQVYPTHDTLYPK